MKTPFRPNSITLQWHVTERCNWRCKHCYQEFYSTPEMKLGDLFRVRDQFLGLLDSFDPPVERARINVTGGEPFARRDILELLAGIAKYNRRWSWSLLSNGSFLDKELAKYLKGLGISQYQVSMEGMEETNDEIRSKGAFRQTIRAIELLREAGIPTLVSLTLSRKNKNEVFALAKFLAPLGVRALGARRIVPWGQGEKMREHLMEPEELYEFYRSIEDMNVWMIRRGYPLRVMGGCESGFFYDRVRRHPETKEYLMNKGWCGVKEGRILTVLPDGAVLPCRRLPIPVGKLFAQTLSEIYRSPAMQAFRAFETEPALAACRRCENWSNCAGGALCVNYGFTRRWNAPDVQCKRIFHSLEEAARVSAAV